LKLELRHMLAASQFNYDADTDKVFKTQSSRIQHIPDVKTQNSLFNFNFD